MTFALDAAWILTNVLGYGGLVIILAGVGVFGWHFVQVNAAAGSSERNDVTSASWKGLPARRGYQIMLAGAALVILAIVLANLLPSRPEPDCCSTNAARSYLGLRRRFGLSRSGVAVAPSSVSFAKRSAFNRAVLASLSALSFAINPLTNSVRRSWIDSLANWVRVSTLVFDINPTAADE
jgi:hypothetical protein